MMLSKRHHLENEKISHRLGGNLCKSYLIKDLYWEYIVLRQYNTAPQHRCPHYHTQTLTTYVGMHTGSRKLFSTPLPWLFVPVFYPSWTPSSPFLRSNPLHLATMGDLFPKLRLWHSPPGCLQWGHPPHSGSETLCWAVTHLGTHEF